MKPRIISKEGQLFAVIPVEEFQRLISLAGESPPLPPALMQRLKDGEHPIRIFREHRGLTQVQLAASSGIARPYLTEIETRKKQGSLPVLKAIAAALAIDLHNIT